MSYRGPNAKVSRLVIVVIAVLVTAAAVSACGGGGSTSDTSASGSSSSGGSSSLPKEITLGAAVAESGWMTVVDEPAMTTANIAIEEINASGGIDGSKVKLVTSNTESETDVGPQAALNVINEGAEAMLVSCDFDQGSPAALTAVSKGMIAMSLCAGSDQFGPSGIGPLAFTAGTPAAVEGAAAAEWATEDQKWSSAYVLTDPTIEYDKITAKSFEERWSSLGGTIVGKDVFNQSAQSISSQVGRIKDLSPQPEVIYLSSYLPGGASAVKQIRAAGITAPILSSEAMESESWMKGTHDLGEFFVTSFASYNGEDSRPEVNELREKYIAKAGKPPTTAAFVMGYSAVQLLQKGIEEAGTIEGTALGAAMQEFVNVPTVAGNTTFTAELHISYSRPAVIEEVVDGKLKFIKVWQPKEVPGYDTGS